MCWAIPARIIVEPECLPWHCLAEPSLGRGASIGHTTFKFVPGLVVPTDIYRADIAQPLQPATMPRDSTCIGRLPQPVPGRNACPLTPLPVATLPTLQSTGKQTPRMALPFQAPRRASRVASPPGTPLVEHPLLLEREAGAGVGGASGGSTPKPFCLAPGGPLPSNRLPQSSSRKRSRHPPELEATHHSVVTALAAATKALQACGFTPMEAALWMAESGSLCLATFWDVE